MTTAYLAGPMRGIKDFNFPTFESAAAQLRKWGYDVLSPAERDLAEGFDPTLNSLEGFNVEEALAADFGMILQSDMIFLLPGWERSRGARAERFVAEMVGKPACFLRCGVNAGWVIEDAPEWDSNPHVPDEKSAVDKVMDKWAEEIRVKNAETGGEKGQKLARFDLIPANALIHLAEHYGKGAAKYADRNWERGYDWRLSFAAIQRHSWQFWSGETYDEDTGSHHMAAVAFHALALITFNETHPELDDRP